MGELVFIPTYKVPLIPDFEETIPATSTESHTLLIDSQAAHSVLVPHKCCSLFHLQQIPHATIEIIVPSKEDPATLAKSNGSDPTDDVLPSVNRHFLV